MRAFAKNNCRESRKLTAGSSYRFKQWRGGLASYAVTKLLAITFKVVVRMKTKNVVAVAVIRYTLSHLFRNSLTGLFNISSGKTLLVKMLIFQ